jgi:hypothetical protein
MSGLTDTHTPEHTHSHTHMFFPNPECRHLGCSIWRILCQSAFIILSAAASDHASHFAGHCHRTRHITHTQPKVTFAQSALHTHTHTNTCRHTHVCTHARTNTQTHTLLNCTCTLSSGLPRATSSHAQTCTHTHTHTLLNCTCTLPSGLPRATSSAAVSELRFAGDCATTCGGKRDRITHTVSRARHCRGLCHNRRRQKRQKHTHSQQSMALQGTVPRTAEAGETETHTQSAEHGFAGDCATTCKGRRDRNTPTC